MNEWALRLEDVEKSYGDFVLEPLSLELPTGSILGLIGPNGLVSKSMLIECPVQS